MVTSSLGPYELAPGSSWPPGPDEPGAGAVGASIEGLPGKTELVERYAERTGRDVVDVEQRCRLLRAAVEDGRDVVGLKYVPSRESEAQ